MKLLLLLLLSSITISAQQTIIRLVNTIPDQSTNWIVGTNIMVRVQHVLWRGVDKSKIEIRAVYPGLPGPFFLSTGDHILGPATLTLQSFFPSQFRGGEEPAVVALVEILPVSGKFADPQRVLIQPSGFAARISVQSSTDLVNWSELLPFRVTNSAPNRFYRLGIELDTPR